MIDSRDEEVSLHDAAHTQSGADAVVPTVKESSDEVNPLAAVTPDALVEPAPRQRTWRDTLAFAIATCGVGFIPLAPGTWGSLLGVLLFAGITFVINFALLLSATGARAINFENPTLVHAAIAFAVVMVLALALFMVGVWAATRVERILVRKDPAPVVFDEIVGQLVTFLPLTLLDVMPLWWLAVGFFLFRLFDIWKPYPIRRFEAIESGLGVMIDDVLAAIYAMAVISILLVIYLLV